MACGAGKECTLFRLPHLATVYHFTHVCSHSPLTPTSPVSLVILTCVVECGCGFNSTGGRCGCDSCPPRCAHCHHSDGVVGTTVQSCQVVVCAITCSVDCGPVPTVLLSLVLYDIVDLSIGFSWR